MKEQNFFRFFFVLIFFCLFLVKTELPVCAGAFNETCIITADNLNLRSTPGKKNNPVKQLKRGTRLEILEHGKKWLKVLYEGRIGYVRNRRKYVHILSLSGISEDKKKYSTLDLVQDEVEKINCKIESKKANIKSSIKKEANLAAKLDCLEQSLNNSRVELRLFRKENAALAVEISKIETQYNLLNKEFRSCEKYFALRLAALYKLNSLGGMYMLASSNSIYKFYQKKRALERILIYDENVRKNLIDTMFKLQRVKKHLNSRKNEKLLIEKKLEDHIILISREQNQRSRLLAELRNKKAMELAALNSLNEAAKLLDKTIKSLNFEPEQHMQASGSRAYGFSTLKGSLKMPVKGKVVNFFGSYKNIKLNITNFRNGIDIKAERGDPIRAVFNGKVIYAKWFKSYGNVVIIDHGKNYCTLYAHIEEMFIAKGDVVEEGDVVATIGDAGSRIGPSLYFEIRHHGKPINPLEWISKDRKG